MSSDDWYKHVSPPAVRLPMHLLEYLRDTYELRPGSTITGLAESIKIPWRAAYEAIASVGRPHWRDLVALRIKNRMQIEIEHQCRVVPEHDAKTRYLLLCEEEYSESAIKNRRWRSYKPKKKPKMIPRPASERLVGAKLGAAVRAWRAKKKADEAAKRAEQAARDAAAGKTPNQRPW